LRALAQAANVAGRVVAVEVLQQSDEPGERGFVHAAAVLRELLRRARELLDVQPDFATPMTDREFAAPDHALQGRKIFCSEVAGGAEEDARVATGLPGPSPDAIAVLLAVPEREAAKRPSVFEMILTRAGRSNWMLDALPRNVQPVVVEEALERLEGLAQSLVPLSCGLLQGLVASSLVGPVVPAGVVPELDVGHQAPSMKSAEPKPVRA